MSSSLGLDIARHLPSNPISSLARKSTSGKPRSRRVAADLVGFADATAVVLGGIVPAYLYGLNGPGLIGGITGAVQLALIVSVLVYAGLRHFNMYDTARMHDFPVEPGKIFVTLGVSFLAILGIGLPFSMGEPHMWIWYAAWWSTSFTLLLGGRVIANKVLATMTAAGAFDTRIAVYGTGTIAGRLDKYLRNPVLGIKFVGVYDDRADESRPATDGPTAAGRMDDLITAGRSGSIDQIIIALPQAADGRTMMIAKQLEQLPVSVHVCTHIDSDLLDDTAVNSVSKIGPVGLLDVKKKPLSDWAPLIKKAEDYVLGLVFIILALPIYALAAIAIKLDSGGPVLFRQRRRGLNKRVFEVLKFRTMHVSQDGDDVPQATRDDPRTTRVGRFLRRTSMDELPQLLNVLKGDMSLVGPRPHALTHDEQYGEQLETYANRHQVKPGMTGWAQVNGFRGETRTADLMKQRVDFDLDYIKNWSLDFDIKILFRTAVILLTNKNTY